MTALSMVLPYHRVSPLYLPRRDLVLDARDSLSLTVTVIEDEETGTSLIDLLTGPTFPTFQLAIYPDSRQRTRWDYGQMTMPSNPLMQVGGLISEVYPGTVTFTVPTSLLAGFPMRCLWDIAMAHDTDLSETLCAGVMHVRGVRAALSQSSGIIILDMGGSVLG